MILIDGDQQFSDGTLASTNGYQTQHRHLSGKMKSGDFENQGGFNNVTSARPMSNVTSARLGVGYNKGRGILNLSSQAQINANANIKSGVIKVNQWTSN